jgi:microcystin-dependent protein
MRPGQDPIEDVQSFPEEMSVGAVVMYAGLYRDTADHDARLPQQWQLCDGATVSRARYPELFALIGTTYGVGDGATTFTLPDIRGFFPIGAGGSGAVLGATTGAASVGVTEVEAPASDVAIGTLSDAAGGTSFATSTHTHTTPSHAHTYANVGLNFLIKVE